MKNRLCFAMLALVGAWAVGLGADAMEGDTPPHATVGQLLANPEIYVGKEVIVQGYVLFANPHLVSEGIHDFLESKEIFDRMEWDRKTSNAIIRKNPKPDPSWEDLADEQNDLEHRYCLALLPVEPFRRNGKYLTGRTVTVRARLEKMVGYTLFNGCNLGSGLVLHTDEVLDPPAPETKPKP